MSRDPRIPVRFADLAAAGADEAVLIEGSAAVRAGLAVARFQLPAFGAHPAGCACCLPRGPVAEALGRLFLARARGEVGFFRSVVAVAATTAGRRAIDDALAGDPVVTARFRLT